MINVTHIFVACHVLITTGDFNVTMHWKQITLHPSENLNLLRICSFTYISTKRNETKYADYSPFEFKNFFLEQSGIWIGFPFIIYGVTSLVAGLSSAVFPETLNQQLPETLEDVEKLGSRNKKDKKNKIETAL